MRFKGKHQEANALKEIIEQRSKNGKNMNMVKVHANMRSCLLKALGDPEVFLDLVDGRFEGEF